MKGVADRASEAYVRTVLGRVHSRLAELAATDDIYERLGPPEAAAESMLALLPEPSPWAKEVGPVYRSEQVRRLLGGVSRQALADRERRRTILALHTADGHVVYPVFQFEGPRIVRGLAEVLQVLEAAPVDRWTLTAWLRAPQDALEKTSVADWLRSGRSVEPLLALARATATRWAA
ncbi:MAG: hypothetical protein M1522_05705 [Actinobacteria bacterium]|nr:hypothetical protein [Actinomycetota bacterium]